MKRVSKENKQDRPSAIVGIGASAGGLEAIESFFKAMPPDSGMAFVVVQHLSPDYKSLMVELLSRKTDMPVHRAEEGMEVRGNNIYLIPPKKNLTIFHGQLLLEDQKQRERVNLPVDIFLRSLADDQGEKAVAIILSGTGSDGTRGVRAIKEGGGIIITQEESSAKFDGMPRAATSTGLADFILPPEEMPSQLQACLNHPYAIRQERQIQAGNNETGITRLFSLLRAKTKVDFTFYKPSTINRRIDRRIAVTQSEDLDEYIHYAEANPSEISVLYRELLIGVTSFFRDPDIMNKLSEKILPDLFANSDNREMRFWVAGCSTGEEAYTLALLCRETMETMGLARDIKIFATDIDRDAITKAGLGMYPESITADLNPTLLTKYFYRRGDQYQVSRTLREMVVFAQHNLVKDPPFTRIDMVSCRNLLIYLQGNLQQRALEMFAFSLRQGGILLLGSSETVGEMEDCFEPIFRKERIYRAQNKSSLLSTTDTITPKTSGKSPLPLMVSGFNRKHGPGAREQERLLTRLLDTLADKYAPLTVVVNENLEILYSLGDSTGIFRLPTGRVNYDISKMVNRELAIPLATGIQKVLRTGEELAYSNISLQIDQAIKKLFLRILLLKGRKNEENLAVVFLEKVGQKEKTDPSASSEYDMNAETNQRMQDLEQELQFTRENLQATIEELETSNEELQATNEELLASNEELQSTNEELQSTNEELYTVNAEYQNKIIELTEARNDVENLLSSSNIGTLILDEDLCIRRYSPETAKVFNLVNADMGRPLKHLSHSLMDFDAIELANEALRENSPVEQEAQDKEGRWYLVKALPYFVGPQTVAGVVITLIDITSLRRTRERLADSQQTASDIVSYMASGLFIYDVAESGDLFLSGGNRAAENMTGLSIDANLGKTFKEIWPGDSKGGINDKLLSFYRGDESVCELEVDYGDDRLQGFYLIHAFRLPGNRLAVSFEDASEKIRAQRELKRSELRYRTLADHGRVLIWTSGLDKRCDYFNKVWLDFTGKTLEEERGDGWLEGVHPDDKERCLQTYVTAFDAQEPFSMTYRLKHRDGSYRWLQDDGSPRYDEEDRFIGYIGHCFDITDRVKAEKALKESEEHHRYLNNLLADAEKSARMGSWTWDVARDEVTWSENLYRLFGLDVHSTPPSFAEHHVLYEPDSMARLREAVKKALEEKEAYELELVGIRSDGFEFPCIARGQAEQDEKGAVTRLYGSLQEVRK